MNLNGDIPGYMQDPDTGILRPIPSVISSGQPYASKSGDRRAGKVVSYREDTGVRLRQDEANQVYGWPRYASGFDDLLSRAIVRGYMDKVGKTPLPITMLSTIVAKRQGMAGTWMTTAHGRKTPVKAFLDLIAVADDSPFGLSQFIEKYVGALDTDNRGAIGSQVPIGVIGFDSWAGYGMNAVPIPGQKVINNQGPTYYVLEMTEESFRENRGLWALDGLHCYPTGDPFYPFWLLKYSEDLKQNVWVLINRDFGFQILQRAGGADSLYAGYGQSGAWRISPYIVKALSIDQLDWEHLQNQPPRGVLWASGLDQPTQFRDQYRSYMQDLEDGESFLYPGVFFGGSKSENAKITLVPWMEPPAGYTPVEWTNEFVSNLAAAFHMNETQLRLRLGEGAMTQAGVAEALEAETSIAWMRRKVEQILNYIAPPRVLVTSVWHSDRTKRFQVETFREMSLAISRIQPKDAGEEPTFTRDEIRALVVNFVGINIPETDGGQITKTDSDDIENNFFGLMGSLPAYALGEDEEIVVWTTGEIGQVIRSNELMGWALVQFAKTRRLLNVQELRLYRTSLALDFSTAKGKQVSLKSGPRVRIVSISEGIVKFRYAWDGPLVGDRSDAMSAFDWTTIGE